MTNDNPAQTIWQNQPVEVTKMSAEMLRKRAGKFEHMIWWRNLREYAGALIAVSSFSYFLSKAHEVLFRAAFALLIAGMVWLVVQLHRKGSSRSMGAAIGSLTCLQFFRVEMVRQRDFVKNVWPWYLAPLVPGFVVYTVAFALTFPRPVGWAGIALLDTVIAAVFYGIWRLNMHAARSLQRKIDELSALETSPDQ